MHTIVDSKTEKKTNLFSRFVQTAQRNPHHVLFKARGGKGKSYTYQEVLTLVRQLAGLLMSDEFSGSSEIGLISENRPEWSITYLAVAAAGKTVVPIDANLKDKEIAYIFDHSKIEVIFTSVRFESFLLDSYGDIKLFSFNEASPNYWMKFLKENIKIEESKADESDVAVLIYTSGTTGDPKAVELTHGNLISNIDGIQKAFCFEKNAVFLSLLPLHHTFEATCGFLTPLMNECTIVYARSLKSKEIIEDIKLNKVTIMIGVPLLYEKMYHSILRSINSASKTKQILFKTLFNISGVSWKTGGKLGKKLFQSLREKGCLDSIRMFISGGAAIPSHISKFYNYLGFDFIQGYGMTECSPVITANRPNEIRFDSCGLPLDGVDVKIDRPDKYGVGEIIVRGKNVTPGYRNNAKETANLIKEGWLYTGDLGKFKHGHLWITGRKKNLIVSAAGKNIYPEQIEENLLGSNLIMETVVFGCAKQGKQGEDVCAVIVPDMEQLKVEHQIDTENPNFDTIKTIIDTEIKRLNADVAEYKRINRFEVQLEELEKTSTKKIKRFIYK